MKAYWKSGGIAPRLLDLDTRWRWVLNFKPRSLYPQGKSRWARSQSERGGEGKNSQPLLGLEPRSFSPQTTEEK